MTSTGSTVYQPRVTQCATWLKNAVQQVLREHVSGAENGAERP